MSKRNTNKTKSKHSQLSQKLLKRLNMRLKNFEYEIMKLAQKNLSQLVL